MIPADTQRELMRLGDEYAKLSEQDRAIGSAAGQVLRATIAEAGHMEVFEWVMDKLQAAPNGSPDVSALASVAGAAATLMMLGPFPEHDVC